MMGGVLSTSTQLWGGSPGAGGWSPSPDAERATRDNPNVPSPPRSTSIGETRSGSSPRRIQVRPPSCVIQSSTVAGPFGPGSSMAYWSLNLGLGTSSVAPPSRPDERGVGTSDLGVGEAIGESLAPAPDI